MKNRIKNIFGIGDIKHLPQWVDYRCLVLVCYSVIVILVMLIHEPWFDEAQAWLIARDSTLKDIIFVRPHYEGHPFLWHLLLKIPAKLGFPYEASIKTINFLFAFFAVYLILYRSPFQKPLKVILPFTYFFLYQYGVISRPYAMLGCAMFLTAMAWKNRTEKPWHLSMALMLLCATSAYGIAIAGGFGVIWLLEKIKDHSLLKGKRTLTALFVLAVFACTLIALIFPTSSTAGLNTTSDGYNYISNLLLCIFMIPAEALFTSFSKYNFLTYQGFSPAAIIISTLISLIIWYLLFSFLHKRKTAGLFLIAYLFFAVIAARYICVHHYGIVLYLILTVLWIGLDISPEENSISFHDICSYMKRLDLRKQKEIRLDTLLTKKNVLSVMVAFFALINVYWNISAKTHIGVRHDKQKARRCFPCR